MQLACAIYAAVAIVLSLVVFYTGTTGKPGPMPKIQVFGADLGLAVLCLLYLAAGLVALKGASWGFWLALLVYGVTTAPGVVMVPLRGAESGVLNSTGIVLALVNDGLAAIVVLWMLAGLVHSRRAHTRTE